ncbi:MAG: SurA N-terminal domain-containing protein, partial [Desulfobacterota bacterium]|nr:SurA N-terminal domain-containing protein [Thermodesulfobacteriota bacterium]
MTYHTPSLPQKKIPAARVNGVVISQYEVEAGLATLLEPYRDTKGKIRLMQQDQYAARKHVIETLITRELLYQEGCRRGITAGEEEVQEGLRAAITEQGSEQQFKAMLMAQGLTVDEYRTSVCRDIIINKVAASVVQGKRKPITDKDAREYYNEHADTMQGPELRRVLHLMIPLDRYAPADEEKKARQRLEQIRQEPDVFLGFFGERARKEVGIIAEDFGYINRGSKLHPLLDAIAFRTPEGAVSRVVRTEDGLHLVMVTTVLEEGKRWPFELIKEELKKKLYEINSVN